MQADPNSQIHALDAYSREFIHGSQYPAVAARDLGRLAALAKAIMDDLDDWGDRLATMNCVRAYARARAALLVMESVFDEVLTPPACRVLAAEIDLLVSPSPPRSAISEPGAG